MDFPSYKVPIPPTHFQASVPTRDGIQRISIARDSGEGVTSSPLIWCGLSISLHGISFGELIP